MALIGYAQETVDIKNSWRESVGENFEVVQLRMENYFADKYKGRGSGYKQWKRWEAEMMYQILPDGTIPNLSELYTDIIAQQEKENPSDEKSLNGNWQNIGPDSYVAGAAAYAPGTGRINCIAFHPTDANTFYVGAARGGVWRTSDGGNSWTPKFQKFANIGVSGIVVGNTNTDLVYVLNGDGDGGLASSGIYKSLDGGETWTNTTLPWTAGSNTRGYKLLIDPNDDDVVYAPTTTGVYKTTDGGSTWTNILPGTWRDMEFKPGDASIYYVVGTDLYRKWDGSVWSGFTFPNNPSRLAITVTPADPDYAYVIEGTSFNAAMPPAEDYRFGGFWQSVNEGVNFDFKTNQPNILGYSEIGDEGSNQAWYDLALIAKNDDAESVLSGGIDLWRTADGGSTFTNKAHWAIGIPPDLTLPYVHADIHALEQNPLDDKVYCGSDGGIYVSSDFGNTWTDLSDGINNGMYYRIDNNEGSTKVIMGAQDNGSMFCTNNDGAMTSIYGADGMECHIAHDDPAKILFSNQTGDLFRTTDNAVTYDYIRPGLSEGAWTTPVDLDPNNSDRIATAFVDTVYVSIDFGSNWTPIIIPGAGLFHSIHFPGDGNVYAATHTKIYKIDPANVVTDITYNLTFSGNTISRISSYWNGSFLEVYVCMGGFNPNSKLWSLSDAQPTIWDNLGVGLPNVPIYCVEWDVTQNKMYAGHGLGVDVWVSGVWKSYSNGMPNQGIPNTAVFDIAVNETNKTVYAAAWGRGLFMSEIESETPPNDLFANAALIECGQGYQVGSTTSATDTDFPGACGSATTNVAPGVWYTIIGTGGDITLSLCGSSHDSQMSIWEDIAGTLTCVNGEDDDNANCPTFPLDPEITLASDFNKTYYIYIYGHNNDVGDFTIDIECDTPTNPNNPCTQNVVTLDAPISPAGLYHAIIKVESNANVVNSAVYKAGNNIELNQNFETLLGVVFEALIEPCN